MISVWRRLQIKKMIMIVVVVAAVPPITMVVESSVMVEKINGALILRF